MVKTTESFVATMCKFMGYTVKGTFQQTARGGTRVGFEIDIDREKYEQVKESYYSENSKKNGAYRLIECYREIGTLISKELGKGTTPYHWVKDTLLENENDLD